MVNLRITLSPTEADALANLAYSELRDPRDQIRWLLRRELERLELLQSDQSPFLLAVCKQRMYNNPMKESTTISGKPPTFPVGFRLPLAQYQQLRKQAKKEGKKVATLVQEWVIEKLGQRSQLND